MRILWGRENSLNVMKIVWLLEELRAPYSRCDVGGSFGQLDTPGFTAMNPNQQIPVLQEDGFTLWESNAILRYLAATVPGAGVLYPAEPRTRANIDRWMDWQQTELADSLGRLFQWTTRTPAHLREPKLIARALTSATRHMAMLEAALGDHAALTGPSLSLADFAIGPFLHRWFTLPIDRPEFAKLAAYHALLLERAAFATHATLPPRPLRVQTQVVKPAVATRPKLRVVAGE